MQHFLLQCDLAALTHNLSVCATIFISSDKMDNWHVPENKTACFFACGLPHLYSMRVRMLLSGSSAPT